MENRENVLFLSFVSSLSTLFSCHNRLKAADAMNDKSPMKSACTGCKHATADGTCGAKPASPDSLQELIRDNLARIKHKLLVLSGKGGVGKSTVAVNLAAGLALRGLKVGLLDADLHGPSIPGMLGLSGVVPAAPHSLIQPLAYDLATPGADPPRGAEPLRVISIGFFLKNRDDAVIWRGPMKISAIKQFLGHVCWGDLDYLVVDSPPGTGDEPLTVAQSIPGAKAVVVTTPQGVSVADVRRSITFCRAVKLDVLGVIENMSGLCCPHCGGKIELFKAGGGEAMARQMGVPFLGRLPIEPAMVAACDEGKPFVALGEAGETGKAIREIVEKIIQRG